MRATILFVVTSVIINASVETAPAATRRTIEITESVAAMSSPA
jgi:hypothetical protein